MGFEGCMEAIQDKNFSQLLLLHLARTQLFCSTIFFLSSTASTGGSVQLLSSSTSPWLTNWVITKFSFLRVAWRPFKIRFFLNCFYCILPGLNFFAKHLFSIFNGLHGKNFELLSLSNSKDELHFISTKISWSCFWQFLTLNFYIE